ncbi:response regulator transcription factor [Phenylobacterium sp.]|jgi:two-component system OmpR family response regulator|uniref:response regulator transcription factor n=1 Tax=Phenylobacterium sp. TaxID=1871053 RepID=UPI002F417536
MLPLPSLPGPALLRVLIIEDDVEAAGHMAGDLAACGIATEIIHDGARALEPGQGDGPFDVLIVDRMLPGRDGLSLLKALRARGVETPALFLTAMGAVADRVAGLQGGGDDYVVKPIDAEELAARVQALARRRSRPGTPETTTLACADLELDRLQRKVRRGGQTIALLPLEYRLLEVLLLSRGQPVTRKMLLEQVWGFRFDPRTNIVETHISRLRAKLGEAGGAPLIHTIRGAGYVIQDA